MPSRSHFSLSGYSSLRFLQSFYQEPEIQISIFGHQKSILTAHNRGYSPVDDWDTLLQTVGIEVACQPHPSNLFLVFHFWPPNSIPTAHIRGCFLVGVWNTLLQTVRIEQPIVYIATSGNYLSASAIQGNTN